jgi:acetolactate synthase I/III small subunit
MSQPTLTPQQMLRRQAEGQSIVPGEEARSRRHVITVRLENSVGALNRVVNMFSARGFDLESLSVGGTDDPSAARMTLVTTGDDRILAQVNRQLERLVDVLVVDDVTGSDHVERELCLVKVRYTLGSRAELLGTLEVFRGKVVDITHDSMTFEVTGPGRKVEAFVDLVAPHGIIEIARSGRVAMRRAVPQAWDENAGEA